MLDFLKKLSLFSIVVLGIIGLLFNTVLKNAYLPVMPWVFAFVVIVTALFHYFLAQSAKSNPKQFGNKYILLSTIKIFMFLIFIVVYMFFNRGTAINFALYFMALYFLYTGFELFIVLKTLNKN